MLANDLVEFSPKIKKLRGTANDALKQITDRYAKIIAEKFGELKKLEDDIKAVEGQIEINKKTLKDGINYLLQKDFYAKNKETLSMFDVKITATATTQQQIDQTKKVLKALAEKLNSLEERQRKDFSQAEKEKKKLEEERDKEIEEEKSKYFAKRDKYYQVIKERYLEEKGRCVEDYNNMSIPNKAKKVPEYISIGNCLLNTNEELAKIISEEVIRIPYDIDAKNEGNVILQIDNSGFDTFDSIVENTLVGLLLNYLEAYPSGSAKVAICSSYFSSMKKLNAVYSAVIKNGFSVMDEPCTNQQRFNMLLNTVENRSNQIRAKLLENDCFDLNGLYEKGIRTEQYQIVVVHNILNGLSEENLKAFYGCIKGLYHCGVRFIIVDDFSTDKPDDRRSASYRNILTQMTSMCQVFELKDGVFTDKNGCNVDLIKVSESMEAQHVYDFCSNYCKNSKENELSYIPYERIGFGEAEADPSQHEAIVIPIGLNEPNVWEVELNCVGKAPIANLVLGKPGTGKSTLIDSMIINGAMKYSPDDVIFQLLDFKDGISSSVYATDECKIPHVKVLSQNNKPEEGGIILSNILAESERRNKEFLALERKIGKTIKNIAEYNREIVSNSYGKKKMPRLIIIIDECQYLFEEESLAKKCEDIVRKCRSQGIHLILATQALSHKMSSTIKFVDGRYCFDVDKDDAEKMLSKKYASLVSSTVPVGSYMAFASNNSGADCEKIRIAWDGGKTDEYAKRIREKWSDYPIDVVSIGDQSPLEIEGDKFESLLSQDAYDIPFGENYSDHSVVTGLFENSRPLVMVGSNQEAHDNILASVVISSIKRGCDTIVVDASMKQQLKSICDQETSPLVKCVDEKDYLKALKMVQDIYEKRTANLRDKHKPLVFVINATQNIADLLDNKKLIKGYELSLSEESESDMSIGEITAQLKQQIGLKTNDSNTVIVGKETLMSLLNNAYKVNMFVCISMDSMHLTSSLGEKLFSHADGEILGMSAYKILVQNPSDAGSNIIGNSFKATMLNGVNENMAFASINQQIFCKFRYYQHKGLMRK